MRDEEWDRAVQTSRAVGQEEVCQTRCTQLGQRTELPALAGGFLLRTWVRHSCQFISGKPSLRPFLQNLPPITTTTATRKHCRSHSVIVDRPSSSPLTGRLATVFILGASFTAKGMFAVHTSNGGRVEDSPPPINLHYTATAHARPGKVGPRRRPTAGQSASEKRNP